MESSSIASSASSGYHFLQDLFADFHVGDRWLEKVVHVISKTREVDGHQIFVVDRLRQQAVCCSEALPETEASVVATSLPYTFSLVSEDPGWKAIDAPDGVWIDSGTLSEYSPGTQLFAQLYDWEWIFVFPVWVNENYALVIQLLGKQAERSTGVSQLVHDIRKISAEWENTAGYILDRKPAMVSGPNYPHVKKSLDMIKALVSCPDPHLVVDLFLEKLADWLGCECVLYLVADQDALVFRRAVGEMPDYSGSVAIRQIFGEMELYPLDVDAGLPVKALVQGRIISKDVLKQGDQDSEEPLTETDNSLLSLFGSPSSIIFIPVLDEGGRRALAWGMSYSRNGARFDYDETLLLHTTSVVSRIFVAAQANVMLQEQYHTVLIAMDELNHKTEQLVVLSRQDSMTGLYNIEFFYEELDRRINEYQRCKGEQFLSVVIFDIDHFAQFSLDHGVPTANLIICDVARRLNKIARKMDIPFRYAGSSFVAILPKCRLSGAVIFADRVRLNVAGEPIETESELFQVTISCGCAEFVPGESAANLIARTESALNRARAQGCNVVCVSEESHEKAIDETVG